MLPNRLCFNRFLPSFIINQIYKECVKTFFFREIPLPQYLHLQEFVQEICLYQQAYL